MSDFGGYGAIVREAQKIAETEPLEVACPLCGEVLDVNKAGVKNCPLGHYRK